MLSPSLTPLSSLLCLFLPQLVIRTHLVGLQGVVSTRYPGAPTRAHSLPHSLAPRAESFDTVDTPSSAPALGRQPLSSPRLSSPRLSTPRASTPRADASLGSTPRRKSVQFQHALALPPPASTLLPPAPVTPVTPVTPSSTRSDDSLAFLRFNGTTMEGGNLTFSQASQGIEPALTRGLSHGLTGGLTTEGLETQRLTQGLTQGMTGGLTQGMTGEMGQSAAVSGLDVSNGATDRQLRTQLSRSMAATDRTAVAERLAALEKQARTLDHSSRAMASVEATGEDRQPKTQLSRSGAVVNADVSPTSDSRLRTQLSKSMAVGSFDESSLSASIVSTLTEDCQVSVVLHDVPGLLVTKEGVDEDDDKPLAPGL